MENAMYPKKLKNVLSIYCVFDVILYLVFYFDIHYDYVLRYGSLCYTHFKSHIETMIILSFIYDLLNSIILDE